MIYPKALGPVALEELLDLFNRSFISGTVPQAWRNAVIIPLLKAGKSASDLASFHPISLTSCVAKLLERMVAERLYYQAEKHQWLNKQQAGFLERDVRVKIRSYVSPKPLKTVFNGRSLGNQC